MNADGTHARRAVSAASKQLVELADGLYVLRIAQRSECRRVLEILRRTEIGGDRLLEIPLLTQQHSMAAFFDGELRRGYSSGRLAVDDDLGAGRRASDHHQRIHRRQMKRQRSLAAGRHLDRPYLGRIAGLAYRYDVFPGA